MELPSVYIRQPKGPREGFKTEALKHKRKYSPGRNDYQRMCLLYLQLRYFRLRFVFFPYGGGTACKNDQALNVHFANVHLCF